MTIPRPFQVGLVVFLVVLVGAAALRLPGLLIAVAALGIPLLFTLCLTPTGRLAVTVVLGIGLGVSFALFSPNCV